MSKKRKSVSKKRQQQLRRQASAAARARRSTNGSPQKAPRRSASRAPQGVDLLNHFDPLAGLRNKLRELAARRGDWSGIPIPLDGQPLVIEPTYQYASIANIAREEAERPDPEDGAKIRNIFWSWHRRARVYIWNRAGEDCDRDSVHWGYDVGKKIDCEIETMGASDAWGLEQEGRAVQTLGTMLRHRAFKQYLLTGMFIETSQRSGVMYLFRKLRPTVAIRSDGKTLRVLCAMCMHPIGYYAGSWGGAMCPTDDVIAHLSLMRGDEVMFWRRCNQHPSWVPEAGL